jgi:tight adherence protein B
VGFLGLPRWYLGYLRKRRQEKFLSELPDALDIMVRGLKSGLPLSDAVKVIATESSPPIGPEFWEVVEGQRIGITIEQGLERMYERIPVQEVSFLAIVLSIQSKTGGNLTEALSNLSKVLRDRRKMKDKIRSVSQEAKSSAAILGSLPLFVAAVLYFVSPEYLKPLWATYLGNILLGLCATLMLSGILVMRKMINFDI